MTIKDFSKLCNCTTQTLRYYDHIKLLIPERVDDMTGYRYYSEEQALLYVRIKNFQEADFTIEEIKKLLDRDDEEVYAAFEKKIAEHEKQLSKIRQIQQSYRNEMNTMKKNIEQFIEKMNRDSKQYNPMQEFGIDMSYYEGIIKKFDNMLHNISDVRQRKGDDAEDPVFIQYCSCNDEDTKEDAALDLEEKDEISPLENPHYTIAAQYHGWSYIKEISDNFAGLEENTEYNFYIEVEKEKECGVIFGYIILQLAEDKNKGRNIITSSCNINISADNKNHLYILKKKPEA